MRLPRSGGGWAAILYTLAKSREAGGLRAMWKALRSRNACKTCALGMGGQLGGMVNEQGRFPEVCKKSIQAMAADMQGRIREHFFADFSLDALRGFSPRDLEHAGRLVEPVGAGPLDLNYRPLEWERAMERIASRLRMIEPEECFIYLSGRSGNEAAFLAQLFARVYGTNHVSNCSYYCHQASGVALSACTGSGTATVTLEDVEHADLILLAGGNPASNHPRLMRTLVVARRRGARVIVINPIRETGLVSFRVPSDPRSLLFGSDIADDYLQPHIGGDVALLAGAAKALLERGTVARGFIAEHTQGWEALEAVLRGASWSDLERRSGVSRREMERLAERLGAAKRCIFAWTMGLTHHLHGVDNVAMLCNLALMLGMVGRPGAGLLPLRGHSNVQGVGSMGVAPQLKEEVLRRLSAEFGVQPPAHVGLDTVAALERAAAGGFKVGICLGGNLFGATPDAAFAQRALGSLDLVVYLSTTLNTGHAWGRGRETIVLPVLARDEEAQATTQESMFNYVRLSDGGPRRHGDVRGGGPRSEVEILVDLAERTFAEGAPRERIAGSRLAAGGWTRYREHDAIRQAIARVVPGYAPIAEIASTRKEFQIPGRTFHEPRFATPSGKAGFQGVAIPEPPAARGEMALMTIRSEGQFNTVVYEDEDRYRGQERRDVILMNPADIARLGLAADMRVTVRSDAGALANVLVRPFEIRAGNCAMYCPEANVLVPRAVDPRSRTPAFKCVPVTISAESAPDAAAIVRSTGSTSAAVRRSLRAC
ncbi:MAG TPA: FdhF/YdeP family oxidoreductase [Phycisphaerales bacterium]|nr:FdhF/YdeP family oxidoreductase [Phycisphaerales bacterium]HMP37222.1 FdhF/YdeP family oxidoreductase [Phycisphaerales bacterium]